MRRPCRQESAIPLRLESVVRRAAVAKNATVRIRRRAALKPPTLAADLRSWQGDAPNTASVPPGKPCLVRPPSRQAGLSRTGATGNDGGIASLAHRLDLERVAPVGAVLRLDPAAPTGEVMAAALLRDDALQTEAADGIPQRLAARIGLCRRPRR